MEAGVRRAAGFLDAFIDAELQGWRCRPTPMR